MTQHIAYRWHGDLYCEEDIVVVLTEYYPWLAWREAGGDPAAADAECELDDIAAMFRIDRSDNLAVAERDFPVRMHKLPSGFCAFCFQWFS